MIADEPNIDALVACCSIQAALLRLPMPPEVRISAKLREILIERGAYESCRRGLITPIELRNLVLAHLQTLICDSAQHDEPGEQTWDDALLRQVDRVLQSVDEANPRSTALLTGYDRDGKIVFEESLDLHAYWDGEHPVIDEDEFRREHGIVRLAGVLYGDDRYVLQELENRYAESGEIVAGTARHADGSTTTF